MRHKTTTMHLIKNLTLIIILFVNFPLMAKGEIYAIGCIDNYPYEYINDAGLPAGFSVELITELAKELNLSCRIELVPYERLIYLKKNSHVDILLGMIKGDKSDDYTFLRTNVKINFSIFSNTNSTISSVMDLSDSKVLVAAHKLIADPVLRDFKKIFKLKSIISTNEINAFTLLKRNECDAVFMSGQSALKIIENQNLIGIRDIHLGVGFFDYGFGVRNNKDDIRSNLAEGYNKIFANGKYDKIYNRWFIEKSDSSKFSETVIYISAGILTLLIFIIFILINSLVLRKRIKEKTEELYLSMLELNKIQVLLQESEKRFKKIFNKTPSGLMILNSSGRVLLFNEAVIKIFGVNYPDEITNLDVINSPVSTEWFKTRLMNYHDIHVEFRFDFEYIKKTGYFSTSRTGVIILELIIIPIEIYTGNPESGYICQFSDNTNERILLEEIKYKQQKHELIFEAVKDGLWEWNLTTDLVKYNRKFFTFLGYKMELYADNIDTLFGFIHENDRESVKKELFEKVLNGRSFNIEYRMMMSNGRLINVRSRGETIEWDDNLKPVRVLGVQTEITIQRDIYTRINLFKKEMKKDENYTQPFIENLLDGRIILIVDDNYLIYLHISELLKKYNVVPLYAGSGLEAIEVVNKRSDISLILLDNYMPGLDGISALREIRKINQSIPVIVQTGQLNDSINDQFFLEGFNGVLGKPVEENLLIETICNTIETFIYKKI